MTSKNIWAQGTPCWADLMAADVGAAEDFYGSLLNWSVVGSAPEYGGYATALHEGASVAGIGPAREGARTGWTLYFAADDADAVGGAIEAAGGRLLAPAMDVGPLGRMLIAADPTGAVFGVWQPGLHNGAEKLGVPGAMVWEDLRTPDPVAAQAFYASVFGFHYREVPMAGADYATFSLGPDREPLGGIGGMMGHDDEPPHWLLYFAVDDVDASVARVRGHGGETFSDPFDTPFGRMLPIRDNGGTDLWVMQLPAG